MKIEVDAEFFEKVLHAIKYDETSKIKSLISDCFSEGQKEELGRGETVDGCFELKEIIICSIEEYSRYTIEDLIHIGGSYNQTIPKIFRFLSKGQRRVFLNGVLERCGAEWIKKYLVDLLCEEK